MELSARSGFVFCGEIKISTKNKNAKKLSDFEVLRSGRFHSNSHNFRALFRPDSSGLTETRRSVAASMFHSVVTVL